MNDLLDIDVSEIQVRNKPVGKVRKLLKHLQGDEYILELDWSSLESFLVCRRSTLWRLIFSRSTYPSSALIYGSAVHSALEVLYRHKALMPDSPAPFASMFAAGEAHFMLNPPSVGEWRDFNTFCTNIEKYVKHYDSEIIKPVVHEGNPAVELPFAQPLGEIDINAECPFAYSLIVENPNGAIPDNEGETFNISRVHIVWTGIIDLIIEQNSQLWIVDHKTSSVIGDSYFKAFELSQQLRGYQWATEKLLGHEIHGAMLNVIAGRKPTKTGVGLELLRRYYPYPRHRIDEWPESILQLSGDLLHSLCTNSFPEETQWCVGKFGTCPYHDVCSEAPDNRLLVLGSDKYCDNVWQPLDS